MHLENQELLQKEQEEGRLLQSEIRYFADSENFPYGTKSEAQLLQILQSNFKRFQEEGVDTILVACNTASTIIDRFPEEFSHFPKLVTIIQPTVTAITHQELKQVVVLGTQFTASSHIYQDQLPDFQVVERAEQNLVIAIEAKDEEKIKRIVEGICDDLPDRCVLVLACTHFSVVKDQFEEKLNILNGKVEIIDSSEELVQRFLSDHIS